MFSKIVVGIKKRLIRSLTRCVIRYTNLPKPDLDIALR